LITTVKSVPPSPSVQSGEDADDRDDDQQLDEGEALALAHVRSLRFGRVDEDG
jgi:hypothetical protein